VIDSVTPTPTLYDQPGLSVIGKAQPAFQYGANVSGGTSTLGYYFSGDYSNKVGAIQIPSLLRDLVVRQTGVGSIDAMKHPSTLQNFSGHSGITANPSPKLDISAVIDYHLVNQRLINPEALYGGSSGRTLVLPPGATGLPGDSLTENFVAGGGIQGVGFALTTQNNQSQHTTLLTQSTLRPLSWLQANAVLGLDMTHATTDGLIPATSSDRTAFVKNSYRNSLGHTATLNTTATNDAGFLSFRSSTGINYVYSRQNDLDAQGGGIPFGGSSLSLASNVSVSPAWAETVELGWYGQEVLGVAKQLYVDGGLRLDGTSRVGQDYHPTAQPKLGVSWIASDAPWLRGRLPGISELRLRSSWGWATRYPTTGMVEGLLSAGQGTLNNQQALAVTRSSLADPFLKPETSTEFEYGADVTLFSRLSVGLSRWHRRTNDELQFVRLAPGIPQVWTNLGDVSQNGFEATATMPLFETRLARGDINFSYSHNTSKLLSLGLAQNAALSNSQYHVGAPLEAIFDYTRLGVVDTVGGGPDGIFESGERVLGQLTYFGVSFPPTTVTLTPQLSFFNNIVRLSALFDRQTGFISTDELARSCANGLTCRAAYIATTPILTQAILVGGNYSDFYRSGDFTRWRELTITADVPRRFLQIPGMHIGISHASVSLQGRNLFLWTKNGGDPETWSDIRQPTAGGGIPQTRSWGFRFDIAP